MPVSKCRFCAVLTQVFGTRCVGWHTCRVRAVGRISFRHLRMSEFYAKNSSLRSSVNRQKTALRRLRYIFVPLFLLLFRCRLPVFFGHKRKPSHTGIVKSEKCLSSLKCEQVQKRFLGIKGKRIRFYDGFDCASV